jgi:hypothetical protein
MIKRLLLASAMVLPITTANAAQFSYDHSGDRIFVYVSGDINSGDDDVFTDYTRNLPSGRQVVVVLNSYGGAMVAGLNIGLRVYNMKWNTSVRSGSVCASVCGMIWLAGTRRWVGPSAHIGFHGAYNGATGQATARGNALCGAYLRDLGLRFEAIAFLMDASADDMTWLTSEKAQRYGIAAETMKQCRASGLGEGSYVHS